MTYSKSLSDGSRACDKCKKEIPNWVYFAWFNKTECFCLECFDEKYNVGMSDEKPQLTDAMVKDFVQSFPKTRFIGTCKDCKWWVEDGFWKSTIGFKNCTHKKLDTDADGSKDGAYIFTTDPTDERFITGPDFGCIHWEARGCSHEWHTTSMIGPENKPLFRECVKCQAFEMLGSPRP